MPETEEDTKKPFENLDLKKIQVFGGKKPQSWTQLAEQSKTLGWKSIDKKTLEGSLARDVDASYFRMVVFTAEDLDTEITWQASFLNDKGLWELEIFGSPRADVEPSEMADFFGSEPFKKIAKQAGWILEEAKKLLEDVVEPKLSTSDLLAIDEIKLAAIYSWLKDLNFMNNFRSGKFMSN